MSRPAPPRRPICCGPIENNYLAAVVAQGRSRRCRLRRRLHGRVPRHRDGARAEVAAALETLERQRGARARRRRSPLPAVSRTELEEWIFGHDYAESALLRALPPALASTAADLPASRWPSPPPAPSSTTFGTRSAPRSTTWTGPSFYRPPPGDGCSTPSPCATSNWSSRCSPGKGKEVTLLHVLDQTATGMGGRLLRQRLASAVARPGRDRSAAGRRSKSSHGDTILRAELRKTLGEVLDLERLLAKVTLGRANPRDLLALGTVARPGPGDRSGRLPAARPRGSRERARANSTRSPKLRDRHPRARWPTSRP